MIDKSFRVGQIFILVLKFKICRSNTIMIAIIQPFKVHIIVPELFETVVENGQTLSVRKLHDTMNIMGIIFTIIGINLNT